MKKLVPLFLLLFAFVLNACDEGGFCLEGEGDVESRTLSIGRFEGIEVHGNSRVFVQKGRKQSIEVKGQPNILNELETKVDGGIWNVEFKRCLRNHETVEVYITVPELSSAHVSGSGYIELEDRFRTRDFKTGVSGSGNIKGKIDVERLVTHISGSGSIDLSGAAKTQEVHISGSGQFNAFDLRSKDVKVDISGSGQAQVNAKDDLNAEISGSGRVYYKGNPATNLDVSGSGKVIKE